VNQSTPLNSSRGFTFNARTILPMLVRLIFWRPRSIRPMQKMGLNHGFSDKQFVSQGTRYKRPLSGDCEGTRRPSRGSASQSGRRFPRHRPRIENASGRFGQSDRAAGAHSGSDSHAIGRSRNEITQAIHT